MGRRREQKSQIKRRHVKIDSDASERDINCDDASIESVASAEKRNLYNEDYTAEKMKEHGWCNNDGTPWSACLPKDEAALFKKGLVDRHCHRQSYGCAASPYLDTLELLKRRMVDKHGRPIRADHPLDFADLGPITPEELIARGYLDRNGHHHKRSPVHILECFFEEMEHYNQGVYNKKAEEKKTHAKEFGLGTPPKSPSNLSSSSKSSKASWDSDTNYDYKQDVPPFSPTSTARPSDARDTSETTMTLDESSGSTESSDPSMPPLSPPKVYPSELTTGSNSTTTLSKALTKELAKDPGAQRSDKQFAIGMDYGNEKDPGKLKYNFLKNGRLYELESGDGEVTLEVGVNICGVRTAKKKKNKKVRDV